MSQAMLDKEVVVEEEQTEQGLYRRKRYQKEHSLGAGEQLNLGKIERCRKIFTSVHSGTIRFDISGDYRSERVCHAGFSRGALSDGGGDFSEGDVRIIIRAPVDASFYIHVEWTEGPFHL